MPHLPVPARLPLAAAALLALTAPALAAPNALCPGLCAGTAIPCGAASDCEDAACHFSPTCLPDGQGHLAPLILRVVPEGPGGLNDPRSGWSCGFVTCEPAADHLAIRSTYGSSTHATKDLALTPGRYLLLADLAAEAHTWGALSVISAPAPPATSPPPPGPIEAWTDPAIGTPAGLGAPTWPRVSASFEVLPTHRGPFQVRLHADGPGRVALRRAVLLQLAPAGLHLRLRPQLGAPNPDYPVWTFELSRLQVPTPSGPRTLVPCDPAASACAASALTPLRLDPDQPWLDLAALAQAAHAALGSSPPTPESAPLSVSARMTATFTLSRCSATRADPPDTSCIPVADPGTVHVDLATAPSDDAVLSTRSRSVVPTRVGLVLPHAPHAPHGSGAPTAPSSQPLPIHPFDLSATFVADLLAPDLAAASALAAANPADAFARYQVGVASSPLSPFDAVPPGTSALSLLADLGLSAAAFFSAPPSPAERAHALTLGLVRQTLTLTEPLAGYAGDLDPENLLAHAEPLLSPLIAELQTCGGLAEACFVRLVHTPRAFSGPLHRAAFHAFLADVGDTPASLGLERLTDAEPLATWPPPARPDPDAEPEAALLSARALEFFHRANARALAPLQDRLLAAARVPVGLSSANTSLAALSLAADERALHGLVADLAPSRPGPDDDCQYGRFGALADLFASVSATWSEAAQARGAPFDLLARVGTHRADPGLVLTELAARGLTRFEHATYGPHDVSPEQARGGLGASSARWLTRVQAANATLARLEPFLDGARRPVSPLAIIAAETDPLQAADPTQPPLDPDELGWHAALTHAQLPVDFMLESDVAIGLLEHPVFVRRALVVTRRHLSAAAWDAIVRWVEAGNTLILGPELAARDERGRLAPERTAWLGVAVGEPIRGGTSLRWTGPLGVSSVLVPGEWREVFALIGTPIAISANDRPVVVRVPRGRGRVIVSGVPLGALYRQPEAAPCDARRPESLPRYPGGHSAVLRQAMTNIAAPGSPTLRSDNPRVTLRRLTTSSGKPFVLVLPWTAGPETVAITINEAASCAFVREELEGVNLPLTFGSLFATFEGPAILTWGEGSSCNNAVESPEVAEPEPPPITDDGGCRSGPLPLGLAALGLFAALRLYPAARGRRFTSRSARWCRRA